MNVNDGSRLGNHAGLENLCDPAGDAGDCARSALDLPLNQDFAVRVRAVIYRGRPGIDIRIWATMPSGRMLPTRHGLRISPEDANAVSAAVSAAAAQLKGDSDA